jgi:hypothetical protein
VSGPFYYIRDLKAERLGQHPSTGEISGAPLPGFHAGQGGVSAEEWVKGNITEIVISRRRRVDVTLVNTSRKSCRLELTSYLELPLRRIGRTARIPLSTSSSSKLSGCRVAALLPTPTSRSRRSACLAAHLVVPESAIEARV